MKNTTRRCLKKTESRTTILSCHPFKCSLFPLLSYCFCLHCFSLGPACSTISSLSHFSSLAVVLSGYPKHSLVLSCDSLKAFKDPPYLSEHSPKFTIARKPPNLKVYRRMVPVALHLRQQPAFCENAPWDAAHGKWLDRCWAFGKSRLSSGL